MDSLLESTDMQLHNNIYRQHVIWDYFLIFLFLASSGAVFWHGMSPAFAFSSLLLIALINVLVIRRNFGKLHNMSLLFIELVVGLCLLNFIFYDPHFKDNSEPAYIIILLASYLIVSRYDFYYFRSIITNIVYVITLFGLIIFGLFEIDVLPTQSVITHTGTPYTMFLIYTLGWPNAFGRYSGIWHEPGACQIILNTILWLHYKNFVEWRWEKGQFVKIAIIILGSLLTMSTGSFMVLMLLTAAVVINIKIRSKYRYVIFLFVFLVAIVGLYLMFNSTVIQNKLFDAEGEHISKVSRLSDINALWTMTLERPILGYGLGTEDFWKMSDQYGNVACSSGILTYSASLGLTWLLFFLVFIWRGIRKLNYGKSTLFFFVAIILMQFNEKFIEYPITNMLLFSFFSYGNAKIQNY